MFLESWFEISKMIFAYNLLKMKKRAIMVKNFQRKKEIEMTEIDIFSGFLGAGKTTLIQKLIRDAYAGQKIVLIENEFGEIGIDGGFLKDAGIEITEMNSGCICCSLVGYFKEALKKVLDELHPQRILIEPSGVGKLSDVIKAVKGVEVESEAVLNHFVTVVDVTKCKMYMKNFGEFFNDQIQYAKTIILSRTQNVTDQKIEEAIALIREKNASARILTTPWEQLEASKIVEAMEASDLTLEDELFKDEHDHECECGHHHEHDHECECGHHHDHHHHADEVFDTWGTETARVFSKEGLSDILNQLSNDSKYGEILRAKGIVRGETTWYYFDMVPGEIEIREGNPDYTGRLCVIGAKIDEQAIQSLFLGA